MGPMKGTPERVSAAELAIIARMSGSFSRSCERTVAQARDEGFALCRSAFALEIAARNTACRERLFLVIDGQWKKIDPRLDRFGRDDCGKDRGFAIGRKHGAVCLAGDLARL